ncbi:MAG: 2-oxo acid dehydrogenase subunit E2 [Spirulinaceae cyanobacterium RM2_2_10]|nr:2-oxo acid dehydrogenase subunit E2 [Spirulinaceae cyanobacterium RM2_2_10]
MPESFAGAQDFDILIADTDDYYKVPAAVVTRRGWRLLVPVVPQYDDLGLEDIAQETATLLNYSLFTDTAPKLRLVVNHRFPAKVAAYAPLQAKVRDRLHAHAIDGFLSPHWLPFVDRPPLDFTADAMFANPLLAVLSELKG